VSHPTHTGRTAEDANYLRSMIERLQRDGMDERDIEAVLRQMSNEPAVRPHQVWEKLVQFGRRAER
jgi:Spy/CpxP family protein refolding chaperone